MKVFNAKTPSRKEEKGNKLVYRISAVTCFA
jgi:hypothetical protein